MRLNFRNHNRHLLFFNDHQNFYLNFSSYSFSYQQVKHFSNIKFGAKNSFKEKLKLQEKICVVIFANHHQTAKNNLDI